MGRRDAESDQPGKQDRLSSYPYTKFGSYRNELEHYSATERAKMEFFGNSSHR